MERKIGLYIGLDSIDFCFDKKENYDTIADRYCNGYGNFGNKFFLSTEIGYLKDEIDFDHLIRYSDVRNDYFISDLTIEQVNERFRAIVLPQANIFNPEKKVLAQLKGFTSFIRLLKIPVFVIGVGIQAKSYNELKHVYKSISVVAKEFCDAVYSTGGEFSLRGYVTKELLDMLGYSDAVVTGCPSLFRNGRDFEVSSVKKEERDNFRPVMNGYSYCFLNKAYSDNFFKYNAYFMDQDEFMGLLYGKEVEEKNIYRLLHKYTIKGIMAAAQGRVCLLYDVSLWDAFLKRNLVNYCFGYRIHGNILSITNGIPSTVVAHDCRTYELADYFSIPYVGEKDAKHIDLYDSYMKCDYTVFNKKYKKKYDLFEQFLIENGLVRTKISIDRQVIGSDEICDFDYASAKDLSVLEQEIGFSQISFAFFDGMMRKNKRMIKAIFLK